MHLYFFYIRRFVLKLAWSHLCHFIHFLGLFTLVFSLFVSIISFFSFLSHIYTFKRSHSVRQVVSSTCTCQALQKRTQSWRVQVVLLRKPRNVCGFRLHSIIAMMQNVTFKIYQKIGAANLFEMTLRPLCYVLAFLTRLLNDMPDGK